MQQELERVCQQDGEVLEKFNELLVQANGSSSILHVDKTVEDARPSVEEVSIETVEAALPKEGPSTKIMDHKLIAGTTVMLHKDDKHYMLSSNADCKLPRGTKLASVGSGKPQEHGDGKSGQGIPLLFSRGDRTWVEIQMGSPGETGEGDDKPTKKGTLYSVTSQYKLICDVML